jgi:hypothetical protein
VSTAPARLELVPPAITPAPAPLADLAARAVAERVRAARLRRFSLAFWAGWCALLPVLALGIEVSGEEVLLPLLFLGMLVVPISGVILIWAAATERSRAGGLALFGAVIALAAGVALLPPAFDASLELFVATRQVELDALAVDIRAVATAEAETPDPSTSLELRMTERFRRRLYAAGMGDGVRVVDGGLIFSSIAGSALLYADGVPGASPMCSPSRLRALGGRWFELDCASTSYSD